MDLSLITSAKNVRRIVRLAENHPDIDEVSEPMVLDSSRVLNMGLPNIDMASLKEALELLTIAFKSVTAALAFLQAVRDELKRTGGGVVVSDPVTGKKRGELRAETSDDALAQLISPRE